jgi:hypothetical protein
MYSMSSSVTPPTSPSPRSLKSSSSTFPATLHTFPVDVGTTTNTSTRKPIHQEKKGKKTSHIPGHIQRHARARFILKLHSIITLPNAEIIQWSNDGRAFTINHPALFEEKLLPEIFAHKSYASFERQLHFYS